MSESKPIRAYVAFGANFGDPARTIGQTLELLGGHPRIEVQKVLALVENPAGSWPDHPGGRRSRDKSLPSSCYST